jgi:hypothetical protein
MVGGEDMGGLRVELDMAIGETSAIESTDKGKMEDLVSRIKDLNGRLGDVRREQVFQRVSFIYRELSLALLQPSHNHVTTHPIINVLHTNKSCQEREAEFRDQSESTNSKMVRYTIIQLVVLGVTCALQLSHLRSFFIKQKLT